VRTIPPAAIAAALQRGHAKGHRFGAGEMFSPQKWFAECLDCGSLLMAERGADLQWGQYGGAIRKWCWKEQWKRRHA
jgi:hypothetical protein